MLALGAVAAAAIAFSGSAAADPDRSTAGKNTTLKMKVDGRDLDFFGGDTVGAGDKLTIVNKTDVMDVGPHTFTLIKPSLMDKKKERKACERFESRVCQNILEAHEVGPPPDFPVGKPNVNVGKNGWDVEFTNSKTGDSWFTETKGDKQVRRVRAEEGDTLGYFCVVHPFMRGKLEVTR
jgi:hypothetical protein